MEPWEDESRVVFWRDPKFVTGSPLLVAVHRGEESIIQRLLELGYTLDAMTVSFSIFSEARSVPMLLRHYPIITPSNDDSFPDNLAYFAVEVGDILTLRLLESMGHDICTASAPSDWQDKRTIFQRAVEKGQREIIDFLLEAGANVNEPADGYGEETALQLAAKNGDL
ncbi:putative serine/threonine-protein kinase ripk4, partial [Fusarium austroafricanum]